MSLSEIRIYQNQVKGFEGEQCFDEIMTFHNPRGFVINDLLIGTQETFYQIDSLLITSDHIYLYEVKNYSGSYYYKDGVIHSKSGHELQDPVAQAERKRAYLHNLLLNLNLKKRNQCLRRFRKSRLFRLQVSGTKCRHFQRSIGKPFQFCLRNQSKLMKQILKE